MNKENVSNDYQDHGHNEGEQNNIPPHGQARGKNNSHSTSDMMQDSPEQKAGREQKSTPGENTTMHIDENVGG